MQNLKAHPWLLLKPLLPLPSLVRLLDGPSWEQVKHGGDGSGTDAGGFRRNLPWNSQAHNGQRFQSIRQNTDLEKSSVKKEFWSQ